MLSLRTSKPASTQILIAQLPLAILADKLS